MPTVAPARVLAVTLGLTLLFTACRDEQAGPKAKTARRRDPVLLDSAPTALAFQSGATLGSGAIVYLGSQWSPDKPRVGQPLRLKHYFQALRQPPADFRFFVHVVDADSRAMLNNADHEIQDGLLPLGAWPVGKVIEDVHTLPTPEPPSGRLLVLLGFWKDALRLPVDSPSARDDRGRVLGPVIEVATDPLPEYRVRRASKAPTIDGELSDPAWANALTVKLVNSFDGSTPGLRTEAKLVYDDANLYAAFDVEDPDVWGTLLQRDEPIYTQEVVEVFLDANADGRTYNELQVSPNNVLFDAYFPAMRQGMDLTFDAQMQTAVKVRGTVNHEGDQDEGWRAEMRIPLARLHSVPNIPPKPGDRWRFNLYRLEMVRRRQQEGQAFSALRKPDFHYLPRFGWLVFE